MESSRPIPVALIGVAGYGAVHTRSMLSLQEKGEVHVAAYCDTAPERNLEGVARLRAGGAVAYTDYKAMLAEVKPEVVVISTPIPLHRPMLEASLAAGCHVLLEKPAAATIQDLRAMIAAQRQAGRIVQVGFQHTASASFRQFQALIRAGSIEADRRVTGAGVWHRDDTYYGRARWAGRLTLDGSWVLDGTLMNPFAHMVNMCLILASPNFGRPARPATVTAELYHANPIESEDTACMRVITVDGVEVMTFTTLTGPSNDEPFIRVEGTQGTAVWNYAEELSVAGPDGVLQPVPITVAPDTVTENLLVAVRGEPVHQHATLDDSLAHLTAANAAFLSAGTPAEIAEPYRCRITNQKGNPAWVVEGISVVIEAAAEQGKLFSELGVPWARPGRTVDTANLTEFALPQEG